MEKKYNIFYGIYIFISVVAFAAVVFHSGLYITHDGVNHIARFAAFSRALQENHFPPRWAGYLNYTYGSPVFNFFYPLPSILAALLLPVIQNPENVFKIISFLAFFAAPITFFLWVRSFLSRHYAIAVSGMYGMSLYHIANLLIRGDVAELVSISFIPLIFSCIDKKQTLKTVVWGGIFYALAILSHNGISLLFSPIIALYVLRKILASPSLKVTMQYGNMAAIGLSLSAFFWIPALLEKKYTNISLFTGDFYSGNFLQRFHAIAAPWGFGALVNTEGGFAPQLGFIPVIVCAILLFRVFYLKKTSSELFFWISVLVLCTIMATPLSSGIWNLVPFLKIIQFPWRFIAISNFALFATTALSIKNSEPKSIGLSMLLLSMTLLTTLPYIRVLGYEKRPVEFYKYFPNTTYFHGEATTVWSTGDFAAFPDHPIEVVSGSATVSSYIKSNTRHTYSITAQTDANIVDNTLYYPGWQVRDNGIKLPIEFQNAHHRGLITYKIPKGSHEIVVSFHETPIRLASDVISGIMCIVVIVYLTRKLFRHENS